MYLVIQERGNATTATLPAASVSGATEREPAFQSAPSPFTSWNYANIREIFGVVPETPNPTEELIERYETIQATLAKTIEAAEQLNHVHESNIKTIRRAHSTAQQELANTARHIKDDLTERARQEVDNAIAIKSRDILHEVATSTGDIRLEIQKEVGQAKEELGRAVGTANTMSTAMKWFFGLFSVLTAAGIIGGWRHLEAMQNARDEVLRVDRRLESFDKKFAAVDRSINDIRSIASRNKAQLNQALPPGDHAHED